MPPDILDCVKCSMRTTSKPSSLDITVQKLGYLDYHDYLASDHWLAVREAYRQSGLPQVCRCCGDAQYQLHHISYKRIGHEALEDFAPLCRQCHNQVHDVSRRHHIKLHEIDEAIRVVRGGIPRPAAVPYRQLTKKNSTKAQRKKYRRLRKAAKRRMHDERRGQPGQILIQCPACHRRAWQDGKFCANCGAMCGTVKKNRTKPPVFLTLDMIDAGRSSNGGWSQRQLQLIGVAWPPKAGWKARAVGRQVDGKSFAKFVSLKDAHAI